MAERYRPPYSGQAMTDDGPAVTGEGEPASGEDRPAPPRSSGRHGKGYFLPGFIALLALLIIGLSVGAGDLSHPAPKSLAGSDVASQISLGIQAEQNTHSPPGVTCPASEPVRQGLHFTCTLAASGHTPARAISVTEVDSRGRLSWTLAPT